MLCVPPEIPPVAVVAQEALPPTPGVPGRASMERRREAGNPKRAKDRFAKLCAACAAVGPRSTGCAVRRAEVVSASLRRPD